MIETDEEYEKALNRIDELMDSTFGSNEGYELNILVNKVVAYEHEQERL